MSSAPRQLWVLAGGNGAGKSTFHRLFLAPRGVQFVNADEIARLLCPEAPESANYDAAVIAGHLREDLLLSGVSFCFETVYSHPGKIDFVARARSFGYQVVLVYIHLADPMLHLARVNQRVGEGGHNVPAGKILSRLPRTLVNIRRTLPLASEMHILDNSRLDHPFQRLATLRDGALTLHQPAADWLVTLLADYLDQA